ncbi:signal peptidase II [Adlercreutzia sp. R21]|uniref:Lipoprotein signal peptidase n=1 Tax=Adlercreutzia wanghongyangiae TaxID=3111451 RepID=A0ABU6IHF8_9ACTN|nr:signal peptidase II [Adlercreutzia sp. R21]MEC4175871.1 signal peptidase II [Adlercreutzia sp. R7]MEC4184157.1 signal peptidase II [Adlercreutzia sp. R21]
MTLEDKRAEGEEARSATACPSLRGRNLAIFAPLAVAWFALDMATKAYFNTFPVGAVAGGPFLGLLQFRLAHNTGAAWGMFGDSTFALGIMSLLVCAALLAYLLITARRASVLEVVGVALVFAGGLGNAVDRFTLGYVVDFIDTTFISFPTFNVADIGVTCGFVLFFAGMLWSTRRAESKDL